MVTNMNAIKVCFFSEREDVKEIRLIPSDEKTYTDLQNKTYNILNIHKEQEINVYQKLSPLASFLSIGGYPLLGKFKARPGCFYEIRYCKQTLFWKAVAREVEPF